MLNNLCNMYIDLIINECLALFQYYMMSIADFHINVFLIKYFYPPPPGPFKNHNLHQSRHMYLCIY